MWGDPAVTRFISGKPSTLQQTWSRILTYVGHWSLLGFGYWAVEEKSSGTFVGELGFADFKRDLEPSLAGVPELGWAFAAHAHGRGYATEAVSAALAWGDINLGVPHTFCIVDPGNTSSVRVAKKCGYAELQRLEYGGKPVVAFDRFASIVN
jgi:RimJ/RimL family protein N-acetyltransferase